jgi:hypothetical protein
MRHLISACLLSAAPGLATAQSMDLESMMLAQSLGTLLASEAFCGLQYDQAAIAAFIATEVSPDDMQFAPTLQMMTLGASSELEGMSASAKTAHCASVTQSARHHKFID